MVNVIAAAFTLFLYCLGSLVGVWQGTDEEGETLLLLEGGKGELDGAALTWRVEGSELIVRMGEMPVDIRFTFRQEGRTLVLRDDEGETSTFRRVGSAPGGGAGGEPAPGPEAPPAPGPGKPPGKPPAADGEDAPPGEKPGTGTGSGTGSDEGGGAVAGERQDHPGGFTFAPPRGWTVQRAQGAVAVLPPDLVEGMETYVLLSGPLEGKGIHDPDQLRSLDQEMQKLAPFLARQGEPERLEGNGLRVVYSGTSPEGRACTGVCLARELKPRAVLLFGIGIAEHVERRDAALRAIYASVDQKKRKPGEPADKGEWLVGLWNSTEKPSSLRTIARDVEFTSDGTFRYHYLTTTQQSGGGGLFTSNEVKRAGTWTFDGGTLTMTFNPAHDSATYPPAADSPHAQARWTIKVERTTDPQGRPAFTVDAEDVYVKQR